MTVSSATNSPWRVLTASLIGTTIEFFDFYIYGTAAVLVFPHLFFPQGDAVATDLQSLQTFALAFFARPIGSAVFGHFGDRIGRKATLVAALLMMGISTVLIGLLPTYQSIGIVATVLLCLCRFGQGFGLGGEWGGAVLLATENAPANKRAWYGMFPQYGAPLGFLCSTGVFLLLSQQITAAEFLAWGWRIPFIASSLLVLVGLYIRLRLEETPAFKQAIEHNERVRMPMISVLTRHTRLLVLATFSGVATFAVFYLMTVFTLGWATSHLGYSRQEFLILQMIATVFLALAILLSALGSDRYGRRLMLMIAAICVIAFGMSFGLLFESGSKVGVLVFLCMGMAVMGLTYGPLGTALSEYFPTAIRYTGASVSFNLAGIIGGSFTPYFASTLANKYSVAHVGYYMATAGLVTLLANWLLPKEAS